MNRRLHNATLAATASGFLLVFALVAADPVAPSSMHAPSLATADAAAMATVAPIASVVIESVIHTPLSLGDSDAVAATRVALMEARIETKARAFEARMERSAANASVGDTVASAMAFAAEISTDVALTSALGALEGSARQAAMPAAIDPDVAERRQHARRIRGALAVPYFSFAQGLRGAGS